jgi:hypothetical protein
MRPTSFISKDFLASTADLLGAVAHLAGPSSLNSARNRRFEAAAQSALLRTVAPEAARISQGRPPAETRDARFRPRGGQYCNCGRCKWCLDNVRWDRIYDEKFADPMYYGGVVVRHNSSLAGER